MTICEQVERLVVWYADAFEMCRESINHGDCMYFAADLIALVGRGRAYWLKDEHGEYGHVVAVIDGLCYDSETPLGVEDPAQLYSLDGYNLNEWLGLGRESDSEGNIYPAPKLEHSRGVLYD